MTSCPLEYRSGDARDKRDVLGTLMLRPLTGPRRYAHITAPRGDAVAQALGMSHLLGPRSFRADRPALTVKHRSGMHPLKVGTRGRQFG